MPIYSLGPDLVFPHPSLSEDGLLAVGGDLSTERLVLAYKNGIFPWYNEEEPILWWSPDPRFVLFPEELKVSKSMRPYFNQGKFRVTIDQVFDQVIDNCSNVPRIGQEGFSSWITPEMKSAYIKLHKEGIAHSVEVWDEEELVGGLYGIALGKVFYGESMFSKKSNASKFGFISLVRRLQQLGYKLIDCQQETPHLASLGARAIDLNQFLSFLDINKSESTHIGHWGDIMDNEIPCTFI